MINLSYRSIIILLEINYSNFKKINLEMIIMDNSKKDNFEVPEDILERWQSIVDIIASISDVSAALIVKSEPPFMKVIVSN